MKGTDSLQQEKTTTFSTFRRKKQTSPKTDHIKHITQMKTPWTRQISSQVIPMQPICTPNQKTKKKTPRHQQSAMASIKMGSSCHSLFTRPFLIFAISSLHKEGTKYQIIYAYC